VGREGSDGYICSDDDPRGQALRFAEEKFREDMGDITSEGEVTDDEMPAELIELDDFAL
jgi:hypothetical protein